MRGWDESGAELHFLSQWEGGATRPLPRVRARAPAAPGTFFLELNDLKKNWRSARFYIFLL